MWPTGRKEVSQDRAMNACTQQSVGSGVQIAKGSQITDLLCMRTSFPKDIINALRNTKLPHEPEGRDVTPSACNQRLRKVGYIPPSAI